MLLCEHDSHTQAEGLSIIFFSNLLNSDGVDKTLLGCDCGGPARNNTISLTDYIVGK